MLLHELVAPPDPHISDPRISYVVSAHEMYKIHAPITAVKNLLQQMGRRAVEEFVLTNQHDFETSNDMPKREFNSLNEFVAYLNSMRRG